jgi:hypothetical protein
MGAGFYGQFLRAATAQPLAFLPWLLGAGCVLEGAAVWLGTSGAPRLRVGDAGIGVEKDGPRYIPWYALERLAYREESRSIVAEGKDESGAPFTVTLPVQAYPQGAAWAVREARTRVPAVVSVPEGAVAEALESAGAVAPLGPVQVVGRRCATSGKIIAFEPDARVCPRCERVYHKDTMPPACVCGYAFAEDPAPAA